MNRVLLGAILIEVALVVAAFVVLRTVGSTAGFVVLIVAVAAPAATATVVIRRAGRGSG